MSNEAHYINLNEVKLRIPIFTDDSGETYVPLTEIRKALSLTPRADVVPRSEMLRWKDEASRVATRVMKMELEQLPTYNDFTVQEGMTSLEILNHYRNLYHAEGNTERGIIANALNDILPKLIEQTRSDLDED